MSGHGQPIPMTARPGHPLNGTANAADLGSPLSGTVTFAAGQTSAVIRVPVVGDLCTEIRFSSACYCLSKAHDVSSRMSKAH